MAFRLSPYSASFAPRLLRRFYLFKPGYGLNDQGIVVQFPALARDLSHLLRVKKTGSGVHSASCSMRIGAPSSQGKQLECEGYHSQPSSAAVKNDWGKTSIPIYAFLARTETLPLQPQGHGSFPALHLSKCMQNATHNGYLPCNITLPVRYW